VHAVVPTRHGFPERGHSCPLAQASQEPPRHTEPWPQSLPSDFVRWVSVHDAVPPEPHRVSPSWQGFAGTHAIPWTHDPVSPPVSVASGRPMSGPRPSGPTSVLPPPSSRGNAFWRRESHPNVSEPSSTPDNTNSHFDMTCHLLSAFPRPGSRAHDGAMGIDRNSLHS